MKQEVGAVGSISGLPQGATAQDLRPNGASYFGNTVSGTFDNDGLFLVQIANQYNKTGYYGLTVSIDNIAVFSNSEYAATTESYKYRMSFCINVKKGQTYSLTKIDPGTNTPSQGGGFYFSVVALYK